MDWEVTVAPGRGTRGVRTRTEKKTPTDHGRNKVASKILSAVKILCGVKSRVTELADVLGIDRLEMIGVFELDGKGP